MKSIRSLAAALAAASLAIVATPAQAQSACTSACGKSFNQCTTAGGAQNACMSKWSQCRSACAGKPTVQSTAAPLPAKTVKPAKP